MSVLLRISAVASLGWALWLFGLDPSGAIPLASQTVALARGLAIANLGLAYLFWHAARDPGRERAVVYTALLVFGLRGANGTYQVLYLLDGPAAVAGLVDMVTSIAMFVGLLNSLPATLRPPGVEPPRA